MGRVVVHVGDVGAGQIVKTANNLVAFATAGVVLEAAALAGRAGIDEQRLIEALGVGSARSWVIENWRFLRHEWRASQPGGAAAVEAIVAKDLELAGDAAGEVGVAAPFAALAAQVVPEVLARRG
jgi:3-hydroxyisobutyrate dehydrogenase